MTEQVEKGVFRISAAAFVITLIWLMVSMRHIPGVFVKADITFTKLKTAVQSSTIDIPFSRQNMQTVVGRIGMPLYLNLVSLTALLRFLPIKDK